MKRSPGAAPGGGSAEDLVPGTTQEEWQVIGSTGCTCYQGLMYRYWYRYADQPSQKAERCLYVLVLR